ncbi:MAG: hypothetical protein ABL925_06190 [Methylococcales bacterium]
MFNANKPYVVNLLIAAFCLLPMSRATAGELPEQVNQLQNQVIAANEKIATLDSAQQLAARTINNLQTNLNAAHQQISDLKNNSDQLAETKAEHRRVANGHGR